MNVVLLKNFKALNGEQLKEKEYLVLKLTGQEEVIESNFMRNELLLDNNSIIHFSLNKHKIHLLYKTNTSQSEYQKICGYNSNKYKLPYPLCLSIGPRKYIYEDLSALEKPFKITRDIKCILEEGKPENTLPTLKLVVGILASSLTTRKWITRLRRYILANSIVVERSDCNVCSSDK